VFEGCFDVQLCAIKGCYNNSITWYFRAILMPQIGANKGYCDNPKPVHVGTILILKKYTNKGYYISSRFGYLRVVLMS
jgi:hypothetical protein